MRVLVSTLALLLWGCGETVKRPGDIHVAAAANLSNVFGELAHACERSVGVRMIPSFGATAQLTQQIENGGPFDLFLSADVEHSTFLVDRDVATSPMVYARGRLVIWAPRNASLQKLEDVARSDVRNVGIAKPELAPYGKAAVQALQASRLWSDVAPKVVYGPNISAVTQYAESGNVDAVFTALALVLRHNNAYVLVDEKLYSPIEQAMCIVKSSQQVALARRCQQFLMSAEGQGILKRNGYGTIALR